MTIRSARASLTTLATIATLALGCSSGGGDSATSATGDTAGTEQAAASEQAAGTEQAPAAEQAPAVEQAPAGEKAPASEHGQHGDHHASQGRLAGADEAPSAASVFFVEPLDGATVSSPVKVRMGVKGMQVHPAGELKEGTGHHHIVVDGGPIERGTVVPADATHIHYGKGQTETELELTPGSHSLTLQFANGAHQSYGPHMSATVTVTVE